MLIEVQIALRVILSAHKGLFMFLFDDIWLACSRFLFYAVLLSHSLPWCRAFASHGRSQMAVFPVVILILVFDYFHAVFALNRSLPAHRKVGSLGVELPLVITHVF